MKQLVFVLASALLLLSAGAIAQEQDADQSSTWRIEFANDAFFDSDNQFTNGFTLQKHGPAASSLDATNGTAAFGKWLGRVFLPDSEGLHYREAWSFGQNMQTPDQIELPTLILDDVPYMGLLAWSSSYVAFDDQRMTGVGWLVGLVGPDSYAEDVQKAVHKMSSAEDPQGWDHQLDNEPVLGLYYTKKRKLWRKRSFDGAVAFNAGLSNFMSYGELALEMRFGRMPKGFVYVPDPIGRGLHYNATIPIDDGTAIYGSIILRATGFLVRLPIEGNNFTDNNPWTELNTIEPKDFNSQVIVGLNFERPKWAFRFVVWFASDSVNPDSLLANEDPDNKGGTITIEWRF
jgi:hypothetical protein